MKLAEEVLAGNRRAIARAITVVENESPEKEALLGGLFASTGKAYVVGITGSPGAGKSSLVDKLTAEIRKAGLSVGIIAVDPTSPFSGGALLGDRIRMQDHVLDDGVFIRSMGTRGSLGGLSRATKEVVKILDASGKDMVLVETVGVGQSELDIMNAVDTTVVVLTPGAGDVVQTMKAGIMEIADVFAVNKADMDGAHKVVVEVGNMLDLDHQRQWRPPVVPTVSLTGKGLAELYAAILQHRTYQAENGELRLTRERRTRSEVIDIVMAHFREKINRQFQVSSGLDGILDRVVQRELDPYQASRTVIDEIIRNWGA